LNYSVFPNSCPRFTKRKHFAICNPIAFGCLRV
jgi:hypothetical protein